MVSRYSTHRRGAVPVLRIVTSTVIRSPDFRTEPEPSEYFFDISILNACAYSLLTKFFILLDSLASGEAVHEP